MDKLYEEYELLPDEQGVVELFNAQNALTTMDKRVYFIILKYMQKNLYPPTLQEIANEAGLRSKSAVEKHLLRLEKNGLIKRPSINGQRNRFTLVGYQLVADHDFVRRMGKAENVMSKYI